MPSDPPPREHRRKERAAPAVDPAAASIAEPPAIGDEPSDGPIGDGFVTGPFAGAGTLIDEVPIAPPQAQAVPAAPVRVGGAIRQPQKISHVAPEYPAIARSARVSGVVILEAMLGGDGSVRDVKVLRSIPLLDQAAVDAVRQWRFTPTLLNGQPVPVIMTVTVSFNSN